MTLNNSLLPRNARQYFIDGPIGKLDILELTPKDTPRGIVIIIHPDPKGGGTYTNKIVQSVAKVMNAKGYQAFCPNLRSVGMSEGEHDFGIAEVSDAQAVYQHAIAAYPGLPVILAGFSFGCAVASNLAAQVDFQQLILIGPAVSRYLVVAPDISRMLVIHGQEDEVVPLAEVYNWAEQYNIPISVFTKTGHFFHGKLIQLQNYLKQMVLV